MDEDSITFGRMPDLEDRHVLRDVFDASYRRLVVQLYGVTGDLDEAEDLVQEAFVRAAAAGPTVPSRRTTPRHGCVHGDQPPLSDVSPRSRRRTAVPRSEDSSTGSEEQTRPGSSPRLRRGPRSRRTPATASSTDWPRGVRARGRGGSVALADRRRVPSAAPVGPVGPRAGLPEVEEVDGRIPPGRAGMPALVSGAPAAVSVVIPEDGRWRKDPNGAGIYSATRRAPRRSTSRPSSWTAWSDSRAGRPHVPASPGIPAEFVRPGVTPTALGDAIADLPRAEVVVSPHPVARWGTTAVHVRVRVPRAACRNGSLPWTFDTRRGGELLGNAHARLDYWVVELGGRRRRHRGGAADGADRRRAPRRDRGAPLHRAAHRGGTVSGHQGVTAPPQDSITFGRKPDPEDCVSLRDVFDASYRRLVVQLYAVTGSFDEAEDVVQEAFVRAAASGRRFLRVDNHEAWLRTTAVNVHRSRWRKLRNGRRANERMVPPREPGGPRGPPRDHRRAPGASRATTPGHRPALPGRPTRRPDRRGARRTGRDRQVTTEPRTRCARFPARPRRRRRRPCLSDCWTAFREEVERTTPVPAFELIEAAGRARRRRRHAIGGVVAACMLAATGLVVSQDGGSPDPQPAEDSDPALERDALARTHDDHAGGGYLRPHAPRRRGAPGRSGHDPGGLERGWVGPGPFRRAVGPAGDRQRAGHAQTRRGTPGVGPAKIEM